MHKSGLFVIGMEVITSPMFLLKRKSSLLSFFGGVILLLQTVLVTLAFHETHSDNLIVGFDPYVAAKDSGVWTVYNEDDLVVLVKLIATRFKSLSLGIEIAESRIFEDYSIHRIPSAVAETNVICRQENSSSLNLLLNIHLNEDLPANRLKFDVGFQLAEKANEIFPGTVTTLHINTHEDPLSEEEKMIWYCRQRMENSTNPYKLAYVITSSQCDKTILELKELIPILRLVDVVNFYIPPQPGNLKPNASRAFFRELEGMMTACKRKMGAVLPKLEVMFETWWPDIYEFPSGSHHPEDLVVFWQLIAEFAMRSNTPIMISQAFDAPHYKSVVSHTGWWKLVERGYSGVSEYMFEEKALLLQKKNGMENLERLPSPKRANFWWNKTFLFVAVGVVTAILVLVAAVTVAVKMAVAKHIRNLSSRLPREDIDSFFNGYDCGDSEEGFLHRDNLAYDKSLEIPLNAVSIDKSALLGSGAFGEVYQAIITKGSDLIPVAAKTTKEKSAGKALRGLMSEVKIMAYLGKHENIVSIVGAHTEQLKSGNGLYLFLELCELGSLEKYLHGFYAKYIAAPSSEPSKFVNHEDRKQIPQLNERKYSLTTEQSFELEQWSLDLAQGMEFLATKKVVHADLATRNVLLTRDKTAKISDFGLSRRLYEYTNYVKSQQEPLPWRWMAPESLRRLEFNEKTDVWAFGITLWEIYSLGELPYQGLAWDVGFSSRLQEGLRLDRPEHDDNNKHAVMKSCWALSPNDRPTFSDLRHTLQISRDSCYVTI